MILSTVKVEDFDRFWNTFSTKGAEKRKQHGSKGAHVFRDPTDADRIWVDISYTPQRFHCRQSRHPDVPLADFFPDIAAKRISHAREIETAIGKVAPKKRTGIGHQRKTGKAVKRRRGRPVVRAA